MKNHKPNSKVILEELFGETVNPYASSILSKQVKEQEHNNEEIRHVQKNQKNLVVV